MKVVFADVGVHGYHAPFFQALAYELPGLVILSPDTSELRQAEVRSLFSRVFRVRRNWRHPNGFTEPSPVELPLHLPAQLLWLKPQVVITTELGARTLLSLIYGRMRPGCRVIVWARLSENSEAGRGRFTTLVRRSMLRLTDGVVVNGTSGERYIRSLGFRKSVGVVPQASAMPSVRKPNRRSEPLKLLYVGRLIALKGLPLLIDSIKQSGLSSQVELAIAGHGPERAAIAAKARDAQVAVTFEGQVDRADLPKLYQRHDVLVLPSLSDEWGLVVVEALRNGMPVLGSTRAQAVLSRVTPGVNGWHFDPLDGMSMRSALEQAALVSDADYAQMVEDAYNSALDLSPEQMAHEFADFVRAVASGDARDT